MKKVLTKTLLFVLVIATLISSVAMLASCSDKEDKNEGGGEINEGAGEVLSYLPSEKFNEDFIFVSRGEGEEFLRETAEGDKVDYAIYMRNRTIENRYGVEIKCKSLEYYDIPAWVADILKANDQKSMDVVLNHIVYSSHVPLAGNAANMQDIPHIDFTKDWWEPSTLADLTLNDKTFIAIGDMCTSAISNTYCMYYNKELCETYKIPNMYDLAITQNNWTYSTMIGYVENLRDDLNKDGRYNADDRYGLVTAGMSSANAYLWAWNNPIFSKTANADDIEFTFMSNTSKISKILDTLVTMYHRKDGVYMPSGNATPASMFVNDQAVFINGLFATAMSDLRDMNADKWGVVPYPKYNAKQTQYITSVDGGHNALCVPKTTSESKLEKIGVILEAMNCLSGTGEGNLVTEFYDKGLKSKYLGDPQEAEVINLIMSNRVFDFGYIYLAFESPAFWIQDMVNKADKGIEGKYTGKRQELEGVIEKAYEAFGLTFPGLP